MRRTKTIEIAGQALTISEIPVSRLFNLFRGEASIATLPAIEAAAQVRELIPLAFEGDFQAILDADLFYDDLQLIYETFKETNPAFFETARAMGLSDALAGLIKTLLQSYSSRLLSLLNVGTDKSPGSGATASSLK